jgi:hypothetical protein
MAKENVSLLEEESKNGVPSIRKDIKVGDESSNQAKTHSFKN